MIFAGVRIKTVTEFLSLRDLATQFSEVTGEKASLALEITREQFEASRHAPHPAAELMYLSWEYVIRAGPVSGVRVRSTVIDDHISNADVLHRILSRRVLSTRRSRRTRSGSRMRRW